MRLPNLTRRRVKMDRITPDLMDAASNESDLNQALYSLQAIAGIDSGDVAGVMFSGSKGEE